MNTGVEGQLGELKNWKYSTQTPYYPGHCGRFEDASAGDFFPRNLTKTSIIKFFSSDLCRYMELEFEKEVSINGILGYMYSAQNRTLDNGKLFKQTVIEILFSFVSYALISNSLYFSRYFHLQNSTMICTQHFF